MLTDREIHTCKPDPARTKRLTDSAGLYLLVQPDGGRWWRWDYSFLGRRKTISFGTYPIVTLARAREKQLEAQRLLDREIDPSAARKKARTEAVKNTFQIVAEEFLAIHARTHAKRTKTKLYGIFNNYLLNPLGALTMSRIEPLDVLTALRPIDEKGLYVTAHRARSLTSQVFQYAVATGRATRDVTVDLRKALTPIKAQNYPAITHPLEIGRLLRTIDGCNGSQIVCTAMKLAPYVFLRSGELRGAEWSEIDLARALWRIPKERMKIQIDEHLVPLSRQVVKLLRGLHQLTGGGRLLFPSMRATARSISDMTLTAALRRLGYSSEEMVIHGFRTIAATRLREIGFEGDLVELQLAHKIRNTVRAAYDRAVRLDERTVMMQAFADHLDQLRVEADRHDAAQRA